MTSVKPERPRGMPPKVRWRPRSSGELFKPEGNTTSLRHRLWRTTQESIVTGLLRDANFEYQDQWLLVVDQERLLFDFLVEDRVLLGCMECASPSYSRAWGTLTQRLPYLDFKFRLAKTMETFTTLVFAEAPACPQRRFPCPRILKHLTTTDYVVTTLLDLRRFITRLLAQDPVAAQSPTAKEHVNQWLALQPSKNVKPKKGNPRPRPRPWHESP